MCFGCVFVIMESWLNVLGTFVFGYIERSPNVVRTFPERSPYVATFREPSPNVVTFMERSPNVATFRERSPNVLFYIPLTFNKL